MPGQHRDGSGREEVPHPNLLVLARGEQATAVRAHREGQHLVGVSFEPALFPGRGQAPARQARAELVPERQRGRRPLVPRDRAGRADGVHGRGEVARIEMTAGLVDPALERRGVGRHLDRRGGAGEGQGRRASLERRHGADRRAVGDPDDAAPTDGQGLHRGIEAHQRMDPLAVEVPRPHRAIERPRPGERPARRENERGHRLAVAREGAHQLQGLEPPEAHGAVVTGGEHLGLLLVERDRAHPTAMAGQGSEAAPVGQIPHAHGPVATPRNHSRASDRDGGDPVFVPLQGAQALAAHEVEDPDHAVGAAGHGLTAVGSEGDGGGVAGVPLPGPDRLPGLEVPHGERPRSRRPRAGSGRPG